MTALSMTLVTEPESRSAASRGLSEQECIYTLSTCRIPFAIGSRDKLNLSAVSRCVARREEKNYPCTCCTRTFLELNTVTGAIDAHTNTPCSILLFP